MQFIFWIFPFIHMIHIIPGTQYVTGFEKTQLPRTIINTEFNYLQYYNPGREADACMKFATIL